MSDILLSYFFTLVLFFGLIKLLSPTYLSYFWSKLNVFYLKNSDVASIRERLTLSIQEFDKRRYDKLKSLNLPYAAVTDLGRTVLFVVDLELAKRILIKDFDNFINRGSFDSQRNIKYYGDMLLTKESDQWQHLRNTLSPIFTASRMKNAFAAFDGIGDKLVADISKQNDGKCEKINLTKCVGKYAMEAITSAAFGVSSGMFEEKTSVFSESKKMFQADITGPLGMLMVIWFPKISAFFKLPLGNKKASAFFVNVLKQAIAERKDTNETRKDFLQVLLDAQKREQISQDFAVNESKISDDIVIANSLLFFLAGFDSTESLIVLTAFELMKNQKVQHKLFEEIDAAVKISEDGKFSYEMINTLPYLEQVISETLRMYSFGIRAERKTSEDYKIPNTESIIPKNTMVDIPVWSIHHDEEYFPNPMSFDPDRFTKENIAKRHPNCYMPFGVGPRHCIAMRYATIQIKVAVAKLVYHFHLVEPTTSLPSKMKFKKTAVMKPAEDLWLSFKSRTAS